MPTLSVLPPYPVFADTDGVPLENGYIWIGAANVDPVSNPITAYWDEAQTLPAAQPIRTLGGYPSNAGTPSNLYVASAYSIRVLNKNGALVYSAANETLPSAEEVTFTQAGSNTATRTVQQKLEEVISVKDYGAVGNGSTDDTVAIQQALDSGAKVVVFPAGGTYIINGGLTLTIAGVTLQAAGATIKLKNSASSLSMLYITGNDCVVDGGTWDGNKANGNTGVWGAAQYNSYNVAMYADRCTVKNIRSVNTWGMGVKGFGNFLSVLNCNIANTTHYGIFFDGSASVSHQGNRAIGNTIDMSAGEVIAGSNQGQGILFTAGTGQNQTDWELADNIIIGPTASVTDQAINLAVRGKDGIVSNNLTRFGAMGFSEGGANCVITGNRFLDLRGTVRYGIEPSGKFTATGNFITDAYEGFSVTGLKDFSGSVVVGNVVNVVSGGLSMGVRFLINAGGSGQNIVISGNTINTPFYGVYLTGDCAGATISGNTLVGPGSGSGRGVFLDTPPAAALVSIIGNIVRGFERAWSVYSVGATTFTDLYAATNNCISIGANEHLWTTEGAAVIGARVCVLNANSGQRSTVSQSDNVFFWYSTTYNNPEGLLAAGPGAVHVSLNSGGGIYRKDTGTGNTGWVAM